jgi:hypothetical protein
LLNDWPGSLCAASARVSPRNRRAPAAEKTMPVYVIAFWFAFSFFMFVIPAKSSGFVGKVVLCIGLSAAANLLFAIFAPEWATTVLGESK